MKQTRSNIIKMTSSEIGDLLFMAVRFSFRENPAEVDAMRGFIQSHLPCINGKDYGCLQRDAAEAMNDFPYEFDDPDQLKAIGLLGGLCRAACLGRGIPDWYASVDQAKMLDPFRAGFKDLVFGKNPDGRAWDISQEDVLLLAKKAFSYAIGRHTYVSSMCEDFAKAHAKDMLPENAAFLASLIKATLPHSYTEEAANGYSSCDVDSFEKAQAYFEEASKEK